ncbi:MAG: YciI family protein [Acidimicrobiales bacterium]
MKYACLIYADENNPEASPEPGSAAFEPIMAGYFQFGNDAGDKIAAGEALSPTNTATSVRVRDGEITTTDGPFAETKEHLGGFYVLECADLDEAIALAAKIPHAALGTIEVRPVIEFD